MKSSLDIFRFTSLNTLFVSLCLINLPKYLSVSHPMVLWLSSTECWEKDFMREIFAEDKFLHVSKQEFIDNYFTNTTNSDGKIFWPRVIVYNIENSGPDAKYEVVREYITKYHPAIIVHMSDEFQGWSKKWKYGEGVEVFNLVSVDSPIRNHTTNMIIFTSCFIHCHLQVPIVLRQYSVKPYMNYDTPR